MVHEVEYKNEVLSKDKIYFRIFWECLIWFPTEQFWRNYGDFLIERYVLTSSSIHDMRDLVRGQ
jgi:hypothetical protein